MRPPPPFVLMPAYPLVSGPILLAIGVTIAAFSGINVSPILLDAHVRDGQPWRLLSSVIVHGGLFHLVFNCYWVWVFGTLITDEMGFDTIGWLMLITALAASGYQYGFETGAVGLSGVGYGFLGFLWVLSRRHRDLRGVIDSGTITAFVVWGIGCIFLTYYRVMNVANTAHAAGLAAGALLGMAYSSPKRSHFVAWWAATVAFTVLGVACALFFRPYVNKMPRAEWDEINMAQSLRAAGQHDQAIRWWKDTVRMRPRNAAYWHQLAIEAELANQPALANLAYERSQALMSQPQRK